MSMEDRLVSKYAKLSDEQKDGAAKKVLDNLKNKKDDKPKKDKKDKSKSKSKDKAKKEEVVEVEEVEESEMSDDDTGMMDSIESLSAELNAIKEDGRVDSSEMISLFQSMMGMVDELLRAKPGRKSRSASMEDRVICSYLVKASRGLQTRRKDKDLMSDTGGISKGRDREPHNKPPRDDVKKRYRTKRKTEKDPDTDVVDKDLKKSSVHPLDRKVTADNFPVSMPEENYYRRVWSSLVDIIASNNGVSEKNFNDRDIVMQGVDGILRSADVMELVDAYKEQGRRPEFCAEELYYQEEV